MGRTQAASGQPDLEGIWTSDDMRAVPMSRPQQYGTRRTLTDEEFATRAKDRTAARAVDEARTGTFRNEEGTRDFSYTSMVIDPPDGRVPAVVADARTRRTSAGPPASGPSIPSTISACGTAASREALTGTWLPVVYGNGTRIIQTPDAVVFVHEMVHESRIIPLDGRPHVGAGIKQLMGDSRGHYEGNTLVVETTNFTDRLAVDGRHPAQRGPQGHRADHPDRSADDQPGDPLRRPEDIRGTVDDADDAHQSAGLRDLRVPAVTRATTRCGTR